MVYRFFWCGFAWNDTVIYLIRILYALMNF